MSIKHDMASIKDKTQSFYYVLPQNSEKRPLASSCVRLSFRRPSTCMEQLGYHWTDFHEILY
jgi:hypothetical protein